MKDRPPIGIVLRSLLLLGGTLGLGAAAIVALFLLADSVSRRPRMDTGVGPQEGVVLKSADRDETPTAATQLPRIVGGSPHDLQASPFVAVAEKVLPAVVSIETGRSLRDDLARRPELRPLFPDLGDGDIEIPSSGSGFLMDPEGHVITNNHVVRDANTITVTLGDGSSYPATLVGTDPATDVALLKIEAGRALPYVELGDSEGLRIGEWVAAIGNPFGNLEGTLTVGVVSAKGRHSLSIAGETPTYQDFIQTDASINFGNSGGPLVNRRGEAVGINTAFNGPGRGISFAIAMGMARRVIDNLMTHGRVVRGYLGIRLGIPDPQVAEEWGLDEGEGILVADVMEGTPAQEAGLERGDVIIAFGDHQATDIRSFMMHVAGALVGEEVEVRFIRDGQEKVTEVRLMERPVSIDGAPGVPDVSVPPDQGIDPGPGDDETPEDGEGSELPSDEGGELPSNERDLPEGLPSPDGSEEAPGPSIDLPQDPPEPDSEESSDSL